jgi:SAM-dependent methyltransferase
MSRATDAWSNYWASGKTSTFGGLDDLASGQSLVELWGSYLGPISPGHVLDVGCGNGSLGQIILQLAQQQISPIKVTGIDSAILPQLDHGTADLTLMGGTAVETLPFEAETFELIVSQFGFEYAAIDEALGEIYRTLKPSGKVLVIGHHRSSWVCRDSFDVIRQMKEAEDSALLISVERLLTRLNELKIAGQSPAQDETAEKLRALVNGTVKELEDSAKKHSNPGFTIQFLNSVMTLFKQGKGDLEAHRDHLKEMSRSLFEYRERLDSQKNVARDDEGWAAIRASFAGSGFRVTRYEPVVINGYHFGHVIEASK